MFTFTGIPYAVPLQISDRWTHSRPMTNLAECHEGTFIAHSQNKVGNQHIFLHFLIYIFTFAKSSLYVYLPVKTDKVALNNFKEWNDETEWLY